MPDLFPERAEGKKESINAEGDPIALNFYEIDSDDPVNLPSLDNIIGDRLFFGLNTLQDFQ